MRIIKTRKVEQVIFDKDFFKVGRPYKLFLTVHNDQDVGNYKIYEIFAILDCFSEETVSFVTSHNNRDALLAIRLKYDSDDSGVSFDISSESQLLKYDSLDKIDIRFIPDF
ncbi:MAG: hypothetical protein IKA36_04960 [Clostridia bacterium]|nr:hypothetical protein [Clostridia bacterium]